MRITKLMLLTVLFSMVFSLNIFADDDYNGYIIRFKDEESREKAKEYLASRAVLMSEDGEEEQAISKK